jgi:hypothetical protein
MNQVMCCVTAMTMIMLKTKVIAIVSLKLQGKIKKIVHHLSSDKESWSVEKQDSDKKK